MDRNVAQRDGSVFPSLHLKHSQHTNWSYQEPRISAVEIVLLLRLLQLVEYTRLPRRLHAMDGHAPTPVPLGRWRGASLLLLRSLSLGGMSRNSDRARPPRFLNGGNRVFVRSSSFDETVLWGFV